MFGQRRLVRCKWGVSISDMVSCAFRAGIWNRSIRGAFSWEGWVGAVGLGGGGRSGHTELTPSIPTRAVLIECSSNSATPVIRVDFCASHWNAATALRNASAALRVGILGLQP